MSKCGKVLLSLVVPHFEVNHPLGHKCQKSNQPPPNQSDLIDQAEYRGMIGNLFSILTHLFIKGDKGLLGMDHSTVM